MRTSMFVAGIVAASLLSTGTALADAPTTAPPSTGTAVRPIGPGEYFNGLVNGATTGGTIRLACPSPFHVGEAGHPVAGQTVSVRQLFPPVAASTLGFTGNASSIAATLLVPSASAAAAAATPPIPLAVFNVYNRPAPIPTTLTLPCGGSGVVVFDPVQGGNTARASREAVKFAFIAAVSG